MQECITLHQKGSLKNLSRELLGEKKWTDEMEIWNESIKTILKHLKPTKRYPRKEEAILRESGPYEIMKGFGVSEKPWDFDEERNKREKDIHQQH